MPQEIVSTLMNSSIFESIEESSLMEIAKLIEKIDFDDGAIIYSEGDRSDAFYIVQSGSVSILKPDIPPKVIEAGESFGETALIDESPRVETIQCFGPTSVYKLSSEKLGIVIGTNPKIGMKIVRNVNRLVSQLNDGETNSKKSSVNGKIISSYSPSGGTGKSFMAVNLAQILSTLPETKSIIVDLNLEFNSVDTLLQLKRDRTITMLLKETDSFSNETVEPFLVKHSDSFYALLGPKFPGETDAIKPDSLNQFLEYLKTEYHYIIIDLPVTLREQTLMALDNSDMIIIISDSQLSSLRNTKAFLEITEQLEYPPAKKTVVLNKYEEATINIEDIKSTFKLEFDFRIINCSADATQSQISGPIFQTNPGSPLTGDLLKLAENLSGQPFEQPKKSWLDSLLKR